jgi:hypothetical protein
MAPFGIGRAKRDRGSGGRVAGEALVLRGDAGYSALSWWTSGFWARVTVPGSEPAYVVHRCRIHRHKIPVAGFVLPVDVDPLDPDSLDVRWDEVPTIEERVASRDPAIVDPEGTWRMVAEARAGRVEPVAGISGAPPERPPWGDGRIDGWPPAEPLPGGRLPGTALVVERSLDPGGNRSGDDYQLPVSPYGGVVADGIHDYLGWLLLCVVPASGSRYGVHVRKSLRRGHLGPVLPVAIHPEKPEDIDIPWRYSPDMTRALAEHLRAEAQAAAGTAERTIAQSTAASERALGQITDPAVRASTEEMMRKFGMLPGSGQAGGSEKE